MASKQTSVFILIILLFSLVSNVQASEESQIISQFGTGFDEVVIADSSDGLFDPRDLEFHPGRADELWIANRGDDSISIIHDTGLDTQYSENREDSNSNHFLEEVSAIAFGAYHPEFDWQWGSAQETQNTYCGLGSPNQFMGPTLWPSSLSHFAIENQNNGNGLLGSHIDMNHESPDGMGIAHDNGNAYWYFDGYYGELVYYDFQVDHDTGQDDHSDGIVHRYSEIQLTRDGGIPGHMILDKESGILYISDTGANRVLWVNTDDTSVSTQNIMNDPSRLEPLAEYSRKTGMEWGVLDTGLSAPSGIALDGDTLFVSENGNGRIVAYDLSDDGKSGVEIDTIQTSAYFIMGLEIGPDGHLYYVDNGKDQVVRIDPYFDMDADGVLDDDDNCPLIANSQQDNHDGDSFGDVCDQDDDNDGVEDVDDLCATGRTNWASATFNDHDMDGCHDTTEDLDDDNDDLIDTKDSCPTGDISWISSSQTDYDRDGCRDAGEDLDDDDDTICDGIAEDSFCIVANNEVDSCPTSRIDFTSSTTTDNDRDGCEDAGEDLDDDNDGFLDEDDYCPTIVGTSTGTAKGCIDTDGDNYADVIDDFPLEPTQWYDSDGDGFGDIIQGFEGDFCVNLAGTSTQDRIGCPDSDGDGWSDADTYWRISSGADSFPDDPTQHADADYDGYGDDQSGFQPDACTGEFGTSTLDVFGCPDSDGDGWSDSNDLFPNNASQYSDRDSDGFGDSIDGDFPDSCPDVFGSSTEQRFGCLDSDGDGWDDSLDKFPTDSMEWIDSDGDGVGDNSDAYPLDATLTVVEEDSSNLPIIAILVLAIISIAVIGLLLTRRNKAKISLGNSEFLPVMSNIEPLPTMAPTAAIHPPLPPEGLPAGWTMEQWSWYGEDYLRNR
ncbi:MAG: hypothetical protein DWB99_08065 [Candidatus Poseidoniales archaeon]|nr:MAG: hypothetical protein DWB99_08065 [Candidatus Poseidoniales archaeon]